MTGALYKPPGVVEKLVRHPFQRNTTVRAAVLVDEDLLSLAYGKQLSPLQLKPLAAGICQIIHSTQQCCHQVVASGSNRAELYLMLSRILAASRSARSARE